MTERASWPFATGSTICGLLARNLASAIDFRVGQRIDSSNGFSPPHIIEIHETAARVVEMAVLKRGIPPLSERDPR